MKTYRAEGGWNYPQACHVISRIRALGCEAGVSTGCIWYAPETIQQALDCEQIILEEGGVILEGGYSSLEFQVLARAEKKHRANQEEAV